MKKSLFLAVAVAPLFSVAAQDNTPEAAVTPAEGTPVLRYELPKGTFFSGDNALLPPAVQLEWINTSYYFGEGLIDDATFQWTLPVSATNSLTLGTETNLKALASLAMPGVTLTPAAAPVLKLAAVGSEKDEYSYKGKIYYGQGTTEMTSFNTYTGLEVKKLTPFTSGNTSANSVWSNLYPTLNNISVTGFAQKIDYPGTPYILNSIEVPGTENASYTLTVFKAPEEVGAMPTEVIISVNVPSTDATEFSAIIDSDIIIAVEDFTDSFQPGIAVAKVEQGVPTPANQGLYTILTALTANGSRTQVMAEYDEAIDGAMPVALDLNLGVSYSFFLPVKDLESDEPLSLDHINVAFDSSVTMAQYLCVTNAKVKDIFVTLANGDDLPSWLNVQIEAVPTETPAEGEGEGETTTATSAVSQAVVITFSQTSATGGTTPVVVNIPDGSFNGFVVTTGGTTGINTVTDEASVVAREYYDIAGRRLIKAPVSGFYIEKAIKADGSVEAISRVR